MEVVNFCTIIFKAFFCYFAAITIGIEDDDLPEDDETIVLQLSNPQGGATLGDTGSSVTVIIGANDYVAGMLGFSQTAYLVSEGMSS